jgi:hypothetical protein
MNSVEPEQRLQSNMSYRITARMQGLPTPTEDGEASVPSEHVLSGPNLNRTFTVRRKAAKRILPWDLPVDEIQLVLPRPQDEDIIQETKRPRLEGPFSSLIDDEATTMNPSHTTTVALPPADAATAADRNDSDPVTDMHSIARTTGAPRYWSPEEDKQLTIAVTNTCKKKRGKEYKADWIAVAALVPSRTKIQCARKWHGVLKHIVDRETGRAGAWVEDEDSKLKDAVQTHGGKDWAAIAALVPGRTKSQCSHRWHNALNPRFDRANGRTGTWTEDEDIKLMNAAQTHGGKDWAATAALVPGRTINQCRNRWHSALDPSIDRATGRRGTWTEDEDIKLKNAVQTHSGKDWAAIAALVPGRTRIQCHYRWHSALDPSIDQMTGRGDAGKWKEDEDTKLKDAVQTHGGKNWVAIAALVPGRTKIQCRNRWHDFFKHSVDRATGRTRGTWTEDEDIKLKDAVQTHGGKNWVAIAALVPGRTKSQCSHRWHYAFNPRLTR